MTALALRRAARALSAAFPPQERAPRAFSVFELWPPALFYIPVALYWARLALRFRSPTLPTAANPGIEAGGLCGESKRSILDQLGPLGRACVARYASIEAGIPGPRAAALADGAIAATGLRYPLVAKPDISCKGTGVRVVRSEAELGAYLQEFPAGARLILQELIEFEGEAGIFYVRRPGEAEGRIVSVTLKYFPRVVGDGRSTLRELILADPRAARLAHLYLARHPGERVLAKGETLRLVFVGNHCKGAIFRDGRHIVTPAMERVFDAIAREIPEFHFGRLDLRFRSLGELQRGEGFRLIEVNGAGSEATHIWDRKTRLVEAYRTLFEHLRLLFEIGDANRRRGFRPLPILALLGSFRRQQRLMRRYPRGD